MGWLTKSLCAMVLFLLMASIGTVSGEVDWSDVVLDDEDDVEDADENPVSGRPDADILEVRVTEEGDNLNVSMMLAGSYNSSGIYAVHLEIDGSESYQFSSTFGGFSAYDSSSDTIPVTGFHSEDGTILSWVVAKSDIQADSSLEIDFAMSTVIATGGGTTVFDYAGMSQIPGEGDLVPKSIDVVVAFEPVDTMVMTMTIVYEGENATVMRSMIDEDGNGTVAAEEASNFVKVLNMMSENRVAEVNITLDGEMPFSAQNVFHFENAQGSTDSIDPISFVMVQTVEWMEPEANDMHTYDFAGEDDAFIGGDEPWDEQVEVSFQVKCPEGWEFDTEGWSSPLKGFLKSDGTVLEMAGADFRASFNQTIATMDSLVIQEHKADDGDDGPGFGFALAVSATAGAALAASRRRSWK